MNIGKTLYGSCGGYFNRNSDGEKIIIAEGHDWIVVSVNGRPDFASFDEGEDEKRYRISEWVEN